MIVPAWMCDSAICGSMKIGTPRVATDALRDLHGLLIEHGFRRSLRGKPPVSRGQGAEIERFKPFERSCEVANRGPVASVEAAPDADRARIKRNSRPKRIRSSKGAHASSRSPADRSRRRVRRGGRR